MLYSIRDNFIKLFVKNKVKQEELRAELAFKHDKIDASERDKRVATANDEPYIKVLQVDFENGQPNIGSFELDWNEAFINVLGDAGYTGTTDESVIDSWFNDVCRNILLENFNDQNFVADAPVEIKREDGKTEKY
jgi:hypothetical protein|tara:strand:- start:471 stop:875 length:405 start_codon:yes stop_codon:yes gene_type:complete